MIYDIHTKNRSFLKMSQTLRMAGVKNNKFMLMLHDESLVGLNPFASDLTAKQKIAIYTECCKNIWYFIREVVRIPGEGDPFPYELNLGNLTLTYLRVRNKNIIEILPRQHRQDYGRSNYRSMEPLFCH